MGQVAEFLPVIIPLLVVEVALIALALYDLTRPGPSVRGGSKELWAIVIVFIKFLGPII